MMPFPVFIRSGTAITAWVVGPVSTPVVPPILGPCNVLTRGDQVGVYDCDSGKLLTTYVFTGEVLGPTELSGRSPRECPLPGPTIPALPNPVAAGSGLPATLTEVGLPGWSAGGGL